MLLHCLIFFPIFMGLLLSIIGNNRDRWQMTFVTTVIIAGTSLWLAYAGSDGVNLLLFSDFGINLKLTSMGALYVALTSLLWLVCVIAMRVYFPENAPHLGRFYGATLVTLGGVLGIFLAADLFTLFVFFEIMSFASFLWVAHNQTTDSARAGDSYLAFGVFGGLSILFGIFLLYGLCPDLSIENLSQNFAPYIGEIQLSVACLFLFFGFGAKAGAFFLHDWLPLAYVQSPAPASALLSGILSKAGVYGILLISVKILAGWNIFGFFLLVIALLNMIIGGLCALTSANLKRVLAFSSISQIGFILWGLAMLTLLGEHGAIAAYGTIFHMMNHSLIKVLLFTLAGIAYQHSHTLDLNRLQGWGKNKPWLNLLFLIGILSVAGIPGFSGYISKTLLHESIVEYILLFDAPAIFTGLEYLFLFAGGCTLAYMLKLYVCLFVEGEGPAKAPYGDIPTKLALSAIALSLVVLGVAPHLTFDVIGDSLAEFMAVHHLEALSYFSLTNLSGSAVSIAIGLTLFWLNRLASQSGEKSQYSELAQPEDTVEYRIYRPALTLLAFLGSFCARICDIITDLLTLIFCRIALSPLKIPDSFYYGDEHKPKVERARIHVTYTLAYSLLMFGTGFLFTIIALLVLGIRG